MDLNMIKGLGPAFRQTLYKSGILNVEDLVNLLPSKVVFHEEVDLNLIKESSNVTIKATILSLESAENTDDHKILVDSSGLKVYCLIKKSQILLKNLIPGSVIRVFGYFNKDNNIIEVYKVFNNKHKMLNGEYLVENMPSTQIQNFIDKGLLVLNKNSSELPDYIKKRIGITECKDILLSIHSPNSEEDFISGLKRYIYKAVFEYFVGYNYYMLSTSFPKEEVADATKLNNAIENFSSILTTDIKSNLNIIFKELLKSIYTNVVIEDASEVEKLIVNTMAIVSKVAMKKQIVIVTEKKFEEYLSLKEELSKHNIKLDVMAKKGRNKENFSNFNSGKCDVLVTGHLNFETLSKDNIGLIIVDNNDIDISVRNDINCSNADTIFYSNTNFCNNIENGIFKNLLFVSFDNKEECFIKNLFDIIFESKNFDILIKMVEIEGIKKILCTSAQDAYNFIKEKKFKETKENYEFLKKVMNKLTEK